MGYTITITNTSVSYVEPKVVNLETISPSLITEPNVPIEEYTSDVTNSDTFVYVPLYKRVQYVKLEAGTSLMIKTDNTDETMYYLNMNLDNVSVTVETGPSDAGLPEVNSDDNGKVLTVVDGAWNKAEPSGTTPFIIDISWDVDSQKYITSITKSQLVQAISDDPYNILIVVEPKETPAKKYILKDTLVQTNSLIVSGSYINNMFGNFSIDTFEIRDVGPQGFGVYYFYFYQYIDSEGNILIQHNEIPKWD